MNFFYPSPKFELGESFSSFLSMFESFCDSVDATAAARNHAFVLSLPEEAKLEMKCIDAEFVVPDSKTNKSQQACSDRLLPVEVERFNITSCSQGIIYRRQQLFYEEDGGENVTTKIARSKNLQSKR
ncbi:unnamed protein product [Clavelina lepadiformis]|uniref:Uncharacterized protein n=1 Tax=Clavelina lepadiformis TaxID=159417 RepID=A0ABP0GHV1_CLALP